MGAKPSYGSGFSIKDNTQDGVVKNISTNSEKYDMGRCKYDSVGTKGYPSQAIQGGKHKY